MTSSLSRAAQRSPIITWERLPADFLLPDDPVDNFAQPFLAAVLREILEQAGFVTPAMLISTNFGLCATADGKLVIEAPDWFLVLNALPIPANQIRRSYTPNLEGDPPLIVMEFLSDTDRHEYSINPYYPYGKWYFYETILRVPYYAIFEPITGRLEFHHLVDRQYQQQTPDEYDRYWIPEINMALGVWHGTKAGYTGYLLRWWSADGVMLPWGTERVQQVENWANQAIQQAEDRANQVEEQLQRLTEYLRSQGIDPNNL